MMVEDGGSEEDLQTRKKGLIQGKSGAKGKRAKCESGTFLLLYGRIISEPAELIPGGCRRLKWFFRRSSLLLRWL